MLKNYIKTAFRNHLKNKWNSLINMFSLSIGITCSILIFVYVSNELSYDRFHENADNIYRITYRMIMGDDEVINYTLSPHELVAEFQENYPGVKSATAYQSTKALIERNNTRFNERFARVDTTFLSMFTFNLVIGNPETALSSHDKIIISEKLAHKFFGDLTGDYSEIIGEILSIYGYNDRQKKDYIITGVFEDVPKTSSFQFELLMLKENNNYYGRSNVAFGELPVYIQLEEGADPETVEQSLKPLVRKIYGKPLDELRSSGVLKDSDDSFVLSMQPLKDVYLNSEIISSYESQSDIMYSYVLAGIGLLILTLACINFINLSIGQSLNRTREIGIRKVLGAARKQVIIQYSLEKFLLIILSLVSGYALAEILLPLFNELSQKDLTISFIDNPVIPAFLFALIIISGFFAAGIPALILSRSNPTGVFNAIIALGGKSRINSVLIVVQFFLSVILLSSAFIMTRQVSYIQNKDLGFDKDQVLVIRVSKEKSEIYKNKISSYPQVLSVTGCDRNFSNGSSSRTFKTNSNKPVQVSIIRVEEEYIKTLGLNLMEGRNFSESFPSDKISSVIVNQTFVEEFELENPIGYIVDGYSFDEEPPQIIGVVNDYHVYSLKSEMSPLILHMTKQINGGWSLLVKIEGDNISGTIELLKEQWESLIPNREFKYTFLDEDIGAKYKSDIRWQKITGISTLLALIISSLGLLGLISIMTNARTKEIGIRKVLGASTLSVVAILSKNITKWIILANALAIPATWYIMNKWLENYAYHIEINWWIFILAGAVTLMFALAAASIQTIKAAIANPVESLRDE